MQEYNINYENKKTNLISTSYLYTKKGVGSWKVLPMFAFKDSFSVKGIIIYSGLEELITLKT